MDRNERIPLILPSQQTDLEVATSLARKRGIVAASILMDSLHISYAAAVHLIDELEAKGICAPDEGLTYHGYSYRRSLC